MLIYNKSIFFLGVGKLNVPLTIKTNEFPADFGGRHQTLTPMGCPVDPPLPCCRRRCSAGPERPSHDKPSGDVTITLGGSATRGLDQNLFYFHWPARGRPGGVRRGSGNAAGWGGGGATRDRGRFGRT